MNTKFKRLASWICALCVTASAVPLASETPDFLTNVQAADSSSSNDVNFTAIGQYTQVTLSSTTETPTWYSSNTNVASVDSTGKITAVGEGSCTVYAVFTNQVLSFNITVTVPAEPTDITVGSLELSSSQPSAKVSLSVDTTGAVWSSSDTSVATVTQDGTITAKGIGSCTVTASVNGKNYIINVTSTYDPSTQPTTVTEVQVGSIELTNTNSSGTITLNGVPDGTVITWSSSDTSVATVDQDGKVTAIGSGECKIIALIGGVKYITNVTSTYDPSTQPTTVTEVLVGSIELTNTNSSGTITLNGVPDGTAITWSSSDTSVATVDQNGKVTAIGSGECKIIALIDGVKYITNVTSTYASVPVPYISAESTEIDKIGGTLQLELKNNSTDAQPEWLSTNENVATVDKNGIVTAVGEGTVVIIATLGGVPYQITLTVKSGVLYGDANGDGEVNITDAVLIMSYAGNSAKYSLTESQLDASDVYSRGDGVNSQDALAVQKYISNSLAELPES